MTDILIRNVPDSVVAKLKALAEAEGLVVEAQGPRRVITAAERASLVKEIEERLAKYPYPLKPMSKAEMREGMEE
jgi:plasmid stability protein